MEGLKERVSPIGKKQSNKQGDAGTRRRGDAEQEKRKSKIAYTERAHISFFQSQIGIMNLLLFIP